MGKTTLTREAAVAPAVVDRFGHRRWFVELETAPNAESLEKAIIVALGLDPASARFDAALARLGQAPGLLVLDNLETPWDGEREKVEAVLASLHRVPQLAVLASIRGNEPPAGVRWTRQRTMHPLEAPHDSEMFRDIATDIKADDPDLAPLLDVARRRSDRDRTRRATSRATRHARRGPRRVAARRQRAGETARRRAFETLVAGCVAGIVVPVPRLTDRRAAAVLHSRAASGRHGAGGREGAAWRRGLRGAAGALVDCARRSNAEIASICCRRSAITRPDIIGLRTQTRRCGAITISRLRESTAAHGDGRRRGLACSALQPNSQTSMPPFAPRSLQAASSPPSTHVVGLATAMAATGLGTAAALRALAEACHAAGEQPLVRPVSSLRSGMSHSVAPTTRPRGRPTSRRYHSIARSATSAARPTASDSLGNIASARSDHDGRAQGLRAGAAALPPGRRHPWRGQLHPAALATSR